MQEQNFPNNSVTPLPQEAPVQIQAPNPSNVPTVLLTILLTVIAGFSGYYFGVTQTSKTQITQVNNPTATAAPTTAPIEDTTSPAAATETSEVPTTWKTYSNSEYSYKYPDTWFIEEMDADRQYFYLSPADIPSPASVFHVSQGPSASIYQKIHFDDPVGSTAEIGDKIFITKTANMKVAGLPAMAIKQTVGEGSATDASDALIIDVDLGTKKPIMVLTFSISGINTENEKILDQVVKSFQFK